jgi:hypothetical protein
MFIETALTTYLLAQTSITALVSTRIYPAMAKQTVTKPYIIISRIDDPGTHTHDGPVAVGRARVQISAFAATWGSAQQIADAVEAVLDGLTGVIGGAGGITVNPIFYDDQVYIYEEETGLHHVAQDYICQTEG